MVKPAPQFRTEADLCAAFIAELPKGWTAYPESCGWDILLVRRHDGLQIGIEAKLRLNAHVINQAISGDGIWNSGNGPDYRAVLIPEHTNQELAGIAAYCAVTVLRVRAGRYVSPGIWPELPSERGASDEWHQLCPTRRCELPEYVPTVAAGVPAPIQLTTWKIGAIRLSVLLAETGYLTRDDFKRFRIDIRRWIAGRWVVARDGLLVAGRGLPDFKSAQPGDWANIAADIAKWQRPAPGLMTSAADILAARSVA